MRNKSKPEIDGQIAEYLSSWPDVDVEPAALQKAAEEVARELRYHRGLSEAFEDELGIKIVFALVGIAVNGLLLFGLIAPFGWDAFSSCLALLLPIPIKYIVWYTCFAVLISLTVLIQKRQKQEVIDHE